MSIAKKINLMLLVTGILVSLAIAVFNYTEAVNRTYSEAYQKADIISAFALATRKYTVQTLRPLSTELVGPDVFHPEIMGGFFVSRAVAYLFSQSVPGYSFKQAALDPINEQNLADEKEREIIGYFKENRTITSKRGEIDRIDGRYIYVAAPVVNEKSCLTCHGSRGTAPKDRVEKYPGDGGYNWTPGHVVATFVTYIPIEKALAELHTSAAKTIAIGIGGVLILVLVTAFFIRKSVTTPILELTQIADNVSKGRDLQKEIRADSKDEIGALYKSIDRMRLGVVKLAQLLSKKSKA